MTDPGHDAVDEIIADLSDRRGLKWEWSKIDEDVREEIRAAWIEIVKRHTSREIPFKLHGEYFDD